MNRLGSVLATFGLSLIGLWLIGIRIAAAAGTVSVSPKTLDFGDHGHGERPAMTLQLRNTGDEPVLVMGIERSCGCLEWSPRTFPRTIAPGGFLALNVTMNSGRAMGVLSKYLTLETNSTPRTIQVPTVMAVFPGYDVKPPQLRFEAALHGDPVTETTLVTRPSSRGRTPRVRGSGQAPFFEFVGVSSNRGASLSSHFAAKVRATEAGVEVSLTLKPTLPEGRFMATLLGRVEGKPFHVPVSGEVFRGILVSPTYFNFNKVDPDAPETLVELAELKSVTGTPFEVLGWEVVLHKGSLEGLELTLEAQPLEGGLRHRLQARLLPPPVRPIQGRFSGRVLLRTDHPEKPTVELGFFGFFPKTP